MATANLLLYTYYKSKDDTYPVVIVVTDGNKLKRFPTGYKVRKDQWNGEVKKHPNAAVINARLMEKLLVAKKYIADRDGRPVNFNLIFATAKTFSFIGYLQRRSEQYKDQIVMKRKTARFAKELADCFGELMMDEINQDKLREFDNYLKAMGNVNNTRHKKFEFLGRFFGNAVEEGLVTGSNPFKSYKISKDPVNKAKLSHDELKAIEDIELTGSVNDARNIFLFSYYTKGQRFETCVTARKSQVRGGRIYFLMNKGKKFISVLLHSRLERLINSYDNEIFIFPFIKEIPDDPAKYISLIGSRNTIVNRDLKVVAALCGIPELSMHIARHTFAYHLKLKTDSIHAIQESLGHSSQRTTEMYLKALDDTSLDKEVGKLYGN